MRTFRRVRLMFWLAMIVDLLTGGYVYIPPTPLWSW